MTATRGDLDALRAASDRMQSANRRLAGPVDGYRTAVQRLNAAASELDVTVVVRAGRIEQIRTTLEAVGAQPAMFATALAAADRVGLGSPGGHRASPTNQLGVMGTLRRIADDPVRAHARHQPGGELAIEIRDLHHDPDVAAAGYDRLAVVLQQLAAGDELVLAAAFAALGPDGVLVVLEVIRDAHLLDDAHGHHGGRVLDPTTDLLAPMTTAFERAARLGLLDPGFGDALTSRLRAGPDGDWRDDERLREHLLLLGQLFVHGDPLVLGDAELTAVFASVVMQPWFEEAVRPLWHGSTTYQRPRPDTGGFDTFSPDGLVARAAIALADDPAAAAHFLADRHDVRHFLGRAEQSWQWRGSRATLPAEVLEAGLLVHPLRSGTLDTTLDPDGRYATSLRSVIDEVLRRDRAPERLTGGLATILAPHRDSFLGLAIDVTSEDDALDLEARDPLRYLTIVMSGAPGEHAITEVMATWSASLIDEWGDSIVPGPAAGATSPTIDVVVSNQLGAHRKLLDLFDVALTDASTRHVDGLGFRFAVIDETDRLLRGRALRQVGLVGGVKGRLASQVLGEAGAATTGQIKDRMIDTGPTPTGAYRAELDARLHQLAIRELVDRLPGADGAFLPVPLGHRDVEVEVDAGGVAGFFGSTVTRTESRPFGAWDHQALLAWRVETRQALREDHGLTVEQADSWWLSPVLNHLTE